MWNKNTTVHKEEKELNCGIKSANENTQRFLKKGPASSVFRKKENIFKQKKEKQKKRKKNKIKYKNSDKKIEKRFEKLILTFHSM